MTRFFPLGPVRNPWHWPPLHVALIAVCYHFNIALALLTEPESAALLIATGGLDIFRDKLGDVGLAIFLVTISTLALIGLALEFRWRHWWMNLALVLPQYFVVAIGAGHGMLVVFEGEYAGRELSRWFIQGALSLFLWAALWHTLAIVWRTRYWMLVLGSQSDHS